MATETLLPIGSAVFGAGAWSGGPSYHQQVDEGVDFHDGAGSFCRSEHADGVSPSVLYFTLAPPTLSGPLSSLLTRLVATFDGAPLPPTGLHSIVGYLLFNGTIVDTLATSGPVMLPGWATYQRSAPGGPWTVPTTVQLRVDLSWGARLTAVDVVVADGGVLDPGYGYFPFPAADSWAVPPRRPGALFPYF